MCDFKPGDEVVCVDAEWRSGPWGRPCPLMRGEVYIVAGTRRCYGFGVDGRLNHKLCVDLKGVCHPYETAFDARRFRKVHRKSTETGMSILRGLLDGEDVSAPVVEIA